MSTTNVPQASFTATGFVPPAETAVLAGVQADLSAAFGQPLNFGTLTNPTPQGQIAESWSQYIGDAQSTFCALANGVDPAFAYGRMQDAIGRIYFLEREPAKPTVVSCICIGAGTIPAGTGLASDTSANIYANVSDIDFPPGGGTVTVLFANTSTGPIPCPAGTLTTIYKVIPGWDSISNPADGVLGEVVEGRAAFELRRQQSVQANSVGFNDSILGAVLGLTGVLDAYVVDNPNAYPVNKTPQAVINGEISGTTLTVTEVVSGEIAVGQSITGSDGSNIGVATGTVIESGSGTSWVVNNSQTVAATTFNLGGTTLAANALYVGVVGGDTTEVATAIWSKKSPGCPYYPGNTTVTIYDPNAQYAAPGVPYVVRYQQAIPLPFCMIVNIANNPGVPSNAATLIQNAVINAFAGADGGSRAKMGSLVFASRYYTPIAALGSWAEIASLFIGSTNTPSASVTAAIGATATGTGVANSLTVSGVTGLISIGDIVVGPGVPSGTSILSQSSGTTGGNGVYVTSQNTTAVASSLTINSTVMTVSAVAAGAVAAGQFAFDASGDIIEGTTVTGQITGSTGSTGTYRLSQANYAPSEGVTLVTANDIDVQALITQAPAIVAGCIQVNLV